MALLDEARDIRSGEQLDATRIDAWIKSHVDGIEGDIQIRQFPGGASNLTYWIGYDTHEFILRRPPFGTKAKSAHDMAREFKVMTALKPVFPLVPTMIALCTDDAVMGCDFYLMERLKGIIPRANLPKELSLRESELHALSKSAIDTLVSLHQAPYKGTPLEQIGKADGYVMRQIDGWSARFRAARTPDVPDCERVMHWLKAHEPAQVATCVIHNDYRFDNLVLDPEQPTRIIGVLDWEMATLGDPLMDLGNTLAYWVQADDPEWMLAMRQQPTHLPGMMTRKQVVEYYCEKMGFSGIDASYYLIYGAFRLAVILQQIYYRYYHGQTQDKRFAPFGTFVASLEKWCLDMIGQA